MPHTSSNRHAGGLIVLLVVAVVAIVAGGVMIAIGVDTYRDGKETKSWTATSGEVLSSTVDSETRTVRRNNRKREETTYIPIVRYAYTVDGVRYEGDDIRADDHGGDVSRAYDIVRRFPEGAETAVYYDPNDPSRAVLVQGAETGQVYLYGGLGGLFGSVGLGILGLAGFVVRRLNSNPA
jgi:hypothetical protein